MALRRSAARGYRILLEQVRAAELAGQHTAPASAVVCLRTWQPSASFASGQGLITSPRWGSAIVESSDSGLHASLRSIHSGAVLSQQLPTQPTPTESPGIPPDSYKPGVFSTAGPGSRTAETTRTADSSSSSGSGLGGRTPGPETTSSAPNTGTFSSGAFTSNQAEECDDVLSRYVVLVSDGTKAIILKLRAAFVTGRSTGVRTSHTCGDLVDMYFLMFVPLNHF